MSMVLKMCPMFVRKYIIILKLVLGDGIGLESRNLLFRSLLVFVVMIWKWFLKCALYMYENYLIILKLVFVDGIRLKSRKFLLRSLMLSEAYI